METFLDAISTSTGYPTYADNQVTLPEKSNNVNTSTYALAHDVMNYLYVQSFLASLKPYIYALWILIDLNAAVAMQVLGGVLTGGVFASFFAGIVVWAELPEEYKYTVIGMPSTWNPNIPFY